MPLQEDEALLAEALKSSMSKATEDGAGGAVTMIEPPVEAEPLAQLIVRWHVFAFECVPQAWRKICSQRADEGQIISAFK
jgi:hypothetical protein